MVKLTEYEKETLLQRAIQEGVSMGALIRSFIRKGK